MFGVNTAYRSPNPIEPMESAQLPGTFALKGEMPLTEAFSHLRNNGLRKGCGRQIGERSTTSALISGRTQERRGCPNNALPHQHGNAESAECRRSGKNQQSKRKERRNARKKDGGRGAAVAGAPCEEDAVVNAQTEN